MTRRQFLRILATAGVFLLCSTAALTDEVRHLKLSEAVRLAIEQNRALKIARFKVQENEHRKEGARSDYFPVITNQSNALHISELQNLSIPPGAFGTATGTPIPNVNTTLPQGKKTFISSGTMIAQPLTQLLRIHQENRIAAAEVASSREDLKNGRMRSRCKCTHSTMAFWSRRFQKKAAEQQTSFSAENLSENEKQRSATEAPSRSQRCKAGQNSSRASSRSSPRISGSKTTWSS